MKNILIVGASSGLGLCLSRYYDKQNFNLFTVGKNISKIKNLKKELSENNKNRCFSFNLQKKKDITSFFKEIRKKKIKFDCVIHCIGGGFGRRNYLIEKKDLDLLFEINVVAPIQINNFIIKNKLYKKNLKLIHIGSVANIETTASVGYSIVKSALLAYTKSISKFFLSKNIFFHHISLGAFEYDQNSFERLKNKNISVYRKFIREKLPRKKIAKANELMGLFDLLISGKGDILTGSTVVADFNESNSFRI